MYSNRAKDDVYRRLKDSETLEEKSNIDHFINIIQVKGVIVENMLERRKITNQDRARECVALPQGQSPMYSIKITGYCNSLKKQRDVTFVKIRPIECRKTLRNQKKPSLTMNY